MIAVRKSDERGHANHGWLNTRFTFSFADYYDPKHVHFRTLRVMNDDRVAGGGGFPMHPSASLTAISLINCSYSTSRSLQDLECRGSAICGRRHSRNYAKRANRCNLQSGGKSAALHGGPHSPSATSALKFAHEADESPDGFQRDCVVQ